MVRVSSSTRPRDFLGTADVHVQRWQLLTGIARLGKRGRKSGDLVCDASTGGLPSLGWKSLVCLLFKL